MTQKVLFIEKKDGLSFYFSYVYSEDFKTLQIEKFFLDDFFSHPASGDGQLVFIEIIPDKNYFKRLLGLLQKHLFRSKVFFVANVPKLESDILEGIKQLCKSQKNLFGFLDMSLPKELHIPLFRHFMSKEQIAQDLVSLEQLLGLQKDLDQISEQMEFELQRIKRMHMHMMPRRYQEIKGITMVSKYAVGEAPGGEFFDIIHRGSKVAVFLSAGQSYLVSSLVLAHFSQLAKVEQLSFPLLRDFIKTLMLEIDKLKAAAPSAHKFDWQFLICLVDLKNLSWEGLNLGNTLLVSEGKYMIQSAHDESIGTGVMSLDRCHFSFRLSRGEKLMLISPGLRRNLKDSLGNLTFVEFFNQHRHLSPFDFINEIFIQLKQQHAGEFLPYDASSILFEVDQKVLLEA